MKFFILNQRYFVIASVVVLALASGVLALAMDSWFWVPAAIFGVLVLVGLHDLYQKAFVA